MIPASSDDPDLERFIVPPQIVTTQTWTDTPAVSNETYGKGVWVRNSEGTFALRKPGMSTASGLEAIREVVAWILACWLQVPAAKIELIEHPTIGPCSLCYDLPGHVYRWYNVIDMKLTEDLYARGKVALQQYGGRAVVLDALVGGADRLNRGNHLFIDGENRWYSIDYGQSFNRFPERTGVGDATMPFGQAPWQQVFPDMIEAIRLSPGLFRDTLNLARSIPADRFEALLALAPAPFASDSDRRAMVDFLKYRQANLGALLGNWCNRNGLTGVLGSP